MGRASSDELNLDMPDIAEAKARLVAAAQELSLENYVKQQPFTAVMLACAAGALVGTSPRLQRIITNGLRLGARELF